VVRAAVRHVAGRGEHAQLESSGIEIEDIFQEVFVRLVKDDFRLLRTFDPNRATLSTWLTIVSRSTAIDCLRRRRLNTVSLEAGQIGAAPESEQSPTSGDAPEATGLPMHLLTDRQRLVLQMLFDDELTVEQVARRMGVDEQTVRSTKHKALTRLREFYGVRNRR
jgi:RNA polymerase sigma-70 factor (ECF subfamily)